MWCKDCRQLKLFPEKFGSVYNKAYKRHYSFGTCLKCVKRKKREYYRRKKYEVAEHDIDKKGDRKCVTLHSKSSSSQ